MTTKTTTVYGTFQQMFLAALEETGITKEAVANEMGVHIASVYRYLGANTPKKPNITTMVRALNRLAMYEVINESDALRVAGYQAEQDTAPTVNGVLIASVIDMMADLPPSTQLDILEIVKGLHRRHGSE